jgi:glutaminyl-peptide cyclotransferase
MELFGRLNNKNIAYVAILVLAASCGGNEQPTTTETTNTHVENIVSSVQTPAFNQDSAYQFIQAQIDFGPRVPGSKAHELCAAYLQSKLASYNFETTVQSEVMTMFDNKKFRLKNIIASYKPEARSRIMISSHWDTRPWADSDDENPDKPIDGANDGASGVGVALEIARQINLINPAIGVDILLFDLEDYGEAGGSTNTWCVGSQYWATHLHKPNYTANFGVLLDMVAGKNAVFPKEGISMQYASAAVDKVWKTAHSLGYGAYFSMQEQRFVGVDDHVFVNRAGIPCIDIIEYNEASGSFGDYHHTHDDNMDIIDKNTLKAVGQILLEVIYTEK